MHSRGPAIGLLRKEASSMNNSLNAGLFPSSAAEGAVPAMLVTRANVGELTQSLPVHVSSILKALTKIEVGSLTATLPNGSRYRFEASKKGPDGDITLYNWNLPKRALMAGTIGVAESYMDRDWDSSDVTTFLELFTVNYDVGTEMASPGFFQVILERFRHWMNTNTKRGSKKNISAH